MTADQSGKQEFTAGLDLKTQVYRKISKIYEEAFHCIMRHQDIADLEQRKQGISSCYSVATQNIDSLFKPLGRANPIDPRLKPLGRTNPIDPRLSGELSNIHEKAFQCMLNAQAIPTIEERKKELESCYAEATQKIHDLFTVKALDSAEPAKRIDNHGIIGGRTNPIDKQTPTDEPSSDTISDLR